MIKELDVVLLKDGREATILEIFDDGKAFLVEISGPDDDIMDMPIVSIDDIEKVTHPYSPPK